MKAVKLIKKKLQPSLPPGSFKERLKARRSEAKTNKLTLLNEYEILQKKIDSYGNSELLYRGFSITILAGAIIYKEKDASPTVLIVGIITLLLLTYFEVKNKIFAKALEERAAKVEHAIIDGASIPAPGIAISMGKAARVCTKKYIFYNAREFAFSFAMILLLFLLLLSRIFQS